jgi:hypothetical protein
MAGALASGWFRGALILFILIIILPARSTDG